MGCSSEVTYDCFNHLAPSLHWADPIQLPLSPHCCQINAGAIGDVRTIHITSRDPAPPPVAYLQNSGGIFMDMTSHDFDMARFLVCSFSLSFVFLYHIKASLTKGFGLGETRATVEVRATSYWIVWIVHTVHMCLSLLT